MIVNEFEIKSILASQLEAKRTMFGQGSTVPSNPYKARLGSPPRPYVWGEGLVLWAKLLGCPSRGAWVNETETAK